MAPLTIAEDLDVVEDDVREVFIDATIDLLQENGFGSITTRQVAKKAEMDHSTIHKQFGSVVDLSIAVTHDLIDQTLEQLTGGRGDPRPSSDGEPEKSRDCAPDS